MLGNNNLRTDLYCVHTYSYLFTYLVVSVGYVIVNNRQHFHGSCHCLSDLTNTSNFFSHLCTQCKKFSQIKTSQDSPGYVMSDYSMKLLTFFDLQLDAQNSYLFTYNTFIKILYMFRALPCSSSGGLHRNCIYAASGIVTVCR
jgi:hypothetical protein